MLCAYGAKEERGMVTHFISQLTAKNKFEIPAFTCTTCAELCLPAASDNCRRCSCAVPKQVSGTLHVALHSIVTVRQ